MLEQVLNIFDIQPDYDLDLMTEAQSPTQVGAAVLSQIDTLLASEHPDWVLVQGDTTTVATATLAAYYRRLRVAHVEAGGAEDDPKIKTLSCIGIQSEGSTKVYSPMF